ncbi:MAG: hypothetical protein WDN76_00550 [Alphaproteobacteria bacterium]
MIVIGLFQLALKGLHNRKHESIHGDRSQWQFRTNAKEGILMTERNALNVSARGQSGDLNLLQRWTAVSSRDVPRTIREWD